MTKRTSKTRAPKKPRAKQVKSKVGGARAGSGPKPKLGAGVVRSVIKTVRLSVGEHDAQLAAVKRGGAKDWAEWARPILNAAAGQVSGLDDGLGVPPYQNVVKSADLGPAHSGGTKYHDTDLIDITADPAATPTASADRQCAMDGCPGCGVCQPGEGQV